MLVLQNTRENKLEASEGDSATDQIIDYGPCFSKIDMWVSFQEVGDRILFSLKYNTDVYDRPLMENLFRHFKQLLSNLMTTPEIPVEKVNFLSEKEREELLNEFNDTTVAYPAEKTVVDLFEEQVAQRPDEIAVVVGERQVTFRELNNLSNQVARYIVKEHGIAEAKPEIVAIDLSDREDLTLVAMLGTLKSGRAYLLIDSTLPQDRIDFLLENSGSINYFNTEDLSLLISSEADETIENLNLNIQASDLAYLIYTSGTTGNPKGVQIKHSSVTNYVNWFTEKHGITSSDSSVITSSLSFDLIYTSFYNCLLNGGQLHFLGEISRKDPIRVSEYIVNRGITFLKVTPSYFNLLLNTPGSSDILKSDALRLILTGGERQHLDDVRRVVNESDIQMVNHYGPSESTIGVCTYEITKANVDRYVLNPVIGNPISNVEIFVLDENLDLQPIGVSGEICISGAGLSIGYLNDPALTDKKFVEHPFRAGQRMYKTGDVGRRMPDGSVEFLGRVDDQVKIRGHRIELGEIESAMLTQEFVSQATVAVKQVGDEHAVVAYVVSESKLDKKLLRDKMSEVLPEYMLPAYCVEMSSIPLTSNGKVNKKALPDVSDNDLIKEEYVAPTTDKEKVLVSVWEDVLKHAPIGVTDNFYNLGGDSIKSIQVASRLKRKGYGLKVELILRNPILKDLIEHMVVDTRVIDQFAVEGPVDLNPVQRFFFENPNNKAVQHYNQSVLLRSRTSLDEEVLKNSIEALVTHHDALRMVYAKKDNDWVQTCKGLKENNFKINFYDLKNDPNGSAKMSALSAEIQASMDLQNGPLFQVGHFRLEDGDRVALIVHHLLVDGVSWRILLEDLSFLYDAFSTGKSTKLPLKTDSFKRWTSLQSTHAQDGISSEDQTYWKNLCEESIASFPTDKEYDSEKAIQYDKSFEFSLDKEITEVLQTKVYDVYRTEINDLLLTSLGLAIKDVFGINKSVLKMEGHGREEIIDGVDVSRTVGWFTSIYPFVLDVSDTDNVEESLVQIKESLRKVPGRGIGYGMLKYLTNSFEGALNPSITFNYLGDFGDKVGNTEESLFEYSAEDIGANIAAENGKDTILSVSGMQVSGELRMNLRYSTRMFDDVTIEKLGLFYERNLRKLINRLSTKNRTYLTPSDLTFKGLTTKELAQINSKIEIEDIYNLSPLQQGIYFHWLSSSSTSMYFGQMSYRLKASSLDVKAVQKTFNQLVERYAILRTSFTNDYADRPLQIVHKKVAENFSYQLAPANLKQNELEKFVEVIREEDRAQGFNLEDSSQMRLKVLDLGEGAYEFIWSYHHVIMDGWCISILINDFSKIFQSISNGKASDLPTPVQYSNYIEWLNNIDEESSLEFWRDYLEGYTNVAEIPFKKKGNEAASYQENKENIVIEGELFDKVNTLCSRLGITQNTFMQGAWGYLISRYNNTQDVVFGAVVSGRPAELAGVEDLVGLFINTVPVRVAYEKEETPESLLKRLQEASITNKSHHYLNLSEVQSESSLGMDLINHIMVFENVPVQETVKDDIEGTQDQDLEIETLEVFSLANYPFSVVVGPTPDSLILQCRYDSQKYDDALIRNLTKHFYNVIQKFIAETDQPLSQLEYLSASEKEEILVGFNDTRNEYPEGETLVSLFEKQVERVPENLAVVFNNKSLSYQELDNRANQLARCLQDDYSVQQGDVIGVQMDRSEWVIVAIMAIMKAGAVYVPIDPQLPAARKSFILEDTKLKLLITETNYMFDLGSYEEGIFAIDVEFDQENYSSEPLNLTIPADDMAYIIYTSGSTGKPKGVMIEHKTIVNTILSQIDILNFKKYQRSLQFASFSFDASIYEIFNTILCGASLYVVGDRERKDHKLLESYLFDREIEIGIVPPSFLKLVDVDKLKKFKALITAGEAPVYDKVKEFLKYGDYYNAYGPTEASICSTVFKLDKGHDLTSGIIPMGKPIDNTQVYILDAFGQSQPVGLVGEICLAGDGLARGYLNRTELTNEKFIPNPFRKGERLYRSGDVGRWLPDGNIEYIGRVDDQLKIRGHRIELGEIEAALVAQGFVKQAVLDVMEVNGTKAIIAYYVLDVDVNKKMIREILSKQLPDYMVPSYYVKMSSIPLNSNGKVDMKALPAATENDLIKEEYVAPRNDMEKDLVEIWEDVLGVGQIGITNNFFDLGGHSLMVMKLLNRIHEKFNLKISTEDIYDASTVKDLATIIQNRNDLIANNDQVDKSKIKRTIEL